MIKKELKKGDVVIVMGLNEVVGFRKNGLESLLLYPPHRTLARER